MLLRLNQRDRILFIGILFSVLNVWFISGCSDQRSDKPVADSVVFNGICDGSAAVMVDEKSMLVAYDESNSLYLYGVSGGQPLADFSYQALLDIDNDEVDVEAVAAVGDGLWWIGSHGLDGDGDNAPNRQLLFKTNAPASADEKLQVLEVVNDLLPIILQADNSKQYFTKKILNKKPKKGGINIEGLAAAADNSLFVGLRSPLTSDDQAIVVQLVNSEQGFVVVDFHQLDLGGRGIRDIQASGNDFLIIAGDVGSGGVFALYQWEIGAKARVLAHLDQHLNPEALVRFADYWLVMSDDGKTTRRDDKPCDDIADHKLSGDESVYFRAIKITQDSLARK